jgi:hypothetical protein
VGCKYLKYLFVFFILFAIYSCNEESLIIPKPCNGGPNLPYDSVRLQLATDIVSENYISVYKNGAISGYNIFVRNGTLFKTAVISGLICEDLNYSINIFYSDTVDNSKLKIEGRLVSPYYATLYWCANTNNNCNYEDIGSIIATYYNNFSGSFSSPLFSGTFTIDLLK